MQKYSPLYISNFDMKKGRPSPILALWILITVSLGIFVALSLVEEIKIGGYTLTKARFPETLFAEDKEMKDYVAEELPDTLATEEPIVIEPDTTVHNVLVIGDSMTHNLAMSIAKYGTKNNYKVTGVTWESSSIPGWSKSDKLGKYLAEVKPDFVIVSLGSNEMELKNFDRRIPEVQKIAAALDTIPYIWVGPPLWKEDKGLYSMLESALPKGVVFKTENVEIERGPDRIHPTRSGAGVWADTLMNWIKTSYHPILAERPDSGTTTRGHKFIYLHPND